MIGPAPTYATVIGSTVQVDKEWKIRNVRGVPPADYPAGRASMTLHLAAETATIDLGPSVFNAPLVWHSNQGVIRVDVNQSIRPPFRSLDQFFPLEVVNP